MRVVLAAICGGMIVCIAWSVAQWQLGVAILNPRNLGLECLANFFAALVAAWVVKRIKGATVFRASAVAFLAMFAFFSTAASHWIWLHASTEVVLTELIIELISWFAAGLLMARIMR